MNFMIMFQPQSFKIIVFINPNYASGILSIIPICVVLIPKFQEVDSSRAAPTLGSTRARGHDDGS